MKSRFEKLWRETAPPGSPCPQPEAREVLRRVNAALGAAPSERREPMKSNRKLRPVLAAVLAVVLAGSAIAAAVNANVLEALFEGDIGPWQELVDSQERSVEDDNYILTVNSAMADANVAFFQISLEGKNEESEKIIQEVLDWVAPRYIDDPFPDPPHISLQCLLHGSDGAVKESIGYGMQGVSPLEEERLGFTAYYSVPLESLESLDLDDEQFQISKSAPLTSAQVRFDVMAEDLWVEVPLETAPSATIQINRTGKGFSTYPGVESAEVTLHQITLSPFTLYMDFTDPTGDGGIPLVSLLMRDGSEKTLKEMIYSHDIGTWIETALIQPDPVEFAQRHISNDMHLIQFQTVLDYENVEAFVFDGRAYPLDGGESWVVDEVAGPFQVSSPTDGVPVQELCERLDASFRWDEESQTAVMEYQGTELCMTVGNAPVIVDGVPSAPVNLYWYYPDSAESPAEDGVLMISSYWPVRDCWGLTLIGILDGQRPNQSARWIVFP